MTELMDYSSITKLNLLGEELDVLPDLSMSINLVILDCSNNNITSLDNLPSNIKELYCYNNITSLDNLPITLKILNCSNNKITILNNLPSSLENLYCDGNPLIYDFNPTLENIRNYNADRQVSPP